MSTFTWEQLQAEQAAWALYNFGVRHPTQPLRGIIEELGELEEAVNKSDQEDAVADCLIFMVDYCSLREINFRGVLVAGSAPRPTLLAVVGRLCHSDLKLEQGIRGTREEHLSAISKMLAFIVDYLLDCIEGCSDQDLLHLVETTWSSVRQRDFKKFPKNGESL